MKSIIAFVFLTVVAFTLGLAIYLGAFKSVQWAIEEQGPYRFVSKTHIGPYHKIVPAIEEVERWAVKNGEKCIVSFGQYIDDPNVVPEDRLRSNGGCVVEKEWEKGLPEGLLYWELPRRLYLVAEFEGAPSIGPMKVYSQTAEKIQKEGYQMDGPAIEMYERVGAKGLRTRYHFPIKR